MKNYYVFYAISILIFVGMNCSKYNEPAPFIDGLTLEYQDVGGKTIYSFHAIEKRQFKIIQKRKREPLNDDIEEMFVDMFGKVYKSSFKDYEGGYSPIWIPVHEMKIGDSFDDGYTVLRKDKWKKWAVLVVKTPGFEEEQYFDINTGYLVGIKGRSGRSYEIALISTNANIPEIKE